jgi:hypothetical protein
MNVVDLLTRYPVRSRFDARENRLTAALSAALLLSDTLCAQLVHDLWPQMDGASGDFSSSDPGRWNVVTQKPIFPPGRHRACFLDLEIVASGGSTRMWIEAKIASNLSGTDQLAKYAATLERESEAHRLLVLIAPERRRTELEKHLPRDRDVPAVFRSWSDVHRALDDWQRESNRRERGRWLATEVMAYMTDQGYGSIRKLSAKQREIVDGAEKAQNAVWHLLEQASERLKRDWRATDAPQGRKRWEGWGEQHFRPSPKRRGIRLDYQSLVLGFEIPLRFGAGVYLRSLTGPKKAAVKDYASRDGWRCDVDTEGPWLWRDMPTDELLSPPDIEAQADALAAFARNTFQMLESAPPDPNDPRPK